MNVAANTAAIGKTLPIVSVVIPTYNHRDFLLESVQSVLSQTFRDYEIIVVNDGSPDDTAEILKPMADAGIIRYVEQRNQGQASARNRGLGLAKGEFVAFLDDDDLWPPDKLEWQVRLLSGDPQLSAIAGGLLAIDEAGEEIAPLPMGNGAVTFESLFDGNPFYSPGQTLIRTERLRSIGGFDAMIWGSDDYDVWFRLIKTGGIERVNRVALRYRQHSLNASRNVTRMFDQTLGVVRKQLQGAPPQVRAAVRIRANRFIYRYAFRNLLNVCKSRFRRGDLTSLFNLSRPIAYVAKQSIRDPRILLWLFLDILPHRWVDLLSKRRTTRLAMEAIRRDYYLQ